MSSLPFTPPRRTSSRNALIFADNNDDDIDATTSFPVRDARPSSPSPSTSDFSVIGADEAEASARDLDYNNSFWSYNTGTPYRGGPFGSFGRRVIYSTPTLNLLSSYNGGEYANEAGLGAGVSGSSSGSNSSTGAALKSLFPRLWDVLVSSPTRNILSTSSSPNSSPTSYRHRNSSYFGTPSYSNSHVHAHSHPYTSSTHTNTNASGGRLTKSRNHRAWEGTQCHCASGSRAGGYYDINGDNNDTTQMDDNLDSPSSPAATTTTAFTLIQDLALDHVPSPSSSSSPTDVFNPRHSLSSQYSYININFSDLPPLDGEEGELIDIDIEDEACYVPIPYGGGLWRQGVKGSFSRARVVTGIDILSMLPTEIALVVLEMLVVATSASASSSASPPIPPSKGEEQAQTGAGGIDSRKSDGDLESLDRRRSTVIHHNYQRTSMFGLGAGVGLVVEYPPAYIPCKNYTPEQALQDLIACTQVSKRWRELAMDNSVWKAAYEGRWGAGIVGGGITNEKSVVEAYAKKQEEVKKRKQKECCMEFWDDEMFAVPPDPDAQSDVNGASSESLGAGPSSRSTISTASPSSSLDYHILYKERLHLDKRWAGSALEKKVIYHRQAVHPLSIPLEFRRQMGIKRKKANYHPLNAYVQLGTFERGGTVYVPFNFYEEIENENRQPREYEEESDDAFIKRMNAMIQGKRAEHSSSPTAQTQEDATPTKGSTTVSTRAVYTRSRPSVSPSTWSNEVNASSTTPTTMSSWEVTSPAMGRSTSSRSDVGSHSRSTFHTHSNEVQAPSHPRSRSAVVPNRRAWAYVGHTAEEEEESSSSESGSGSGSGSGKSSGSKSLSSVSTLRARARNFPSRAFSRSRSRGGADSPSPLGKEKQKAESSKLRPKVTPQPQPKLLTPEERRKEKEREVYRLLKGTVRVEGEEWEKWEPKVMRISGHVDSVYCIELPSSSESFVSTANEYQFDATTPPPIRSAEMNKIFVTGSRDRTIKMWSLKTGRCLGTFGVRKDGHMGEGLVLSGGPPGVRVPNFENEGAKGARPVDEPLTEDERMGHKGSVLCLKFIWEKYGLDADEREQWKEGGVKQRWSRWKGKGKEVDEPRDTKMIGRRGVMLSGSSDNTICVWDVWEEIKLGGESKSNRHPEMEGPHIDEFEEDDPEDVAYQQYEMKARVRKVLRAHTGGVLDLRVDDKWIVSCSKDTTIRVWNRSTLQMHRIMRGHEGPVNAVGMVDGKVVSASGDGKMILWDVKSGERLRTFEGHDRGLACIEYKGDLIISGSNDCKIKMWSAETGECLCTLEGHEALVRALAYDPSSGRLVSVSYDKSVRVWDVKDVRDGSRTKSGSEGRLLREFRNAHTSQIFDVRFDLSRIVSTSHDHNIVVADFEGQLGSAELFV